MFKIIRIIKEAFRYALDIEKAMKRDEKQLEEEFAVELQFEESVRFYKK